MTGLKYCCHLLSLSNVKLKWFIKATQFVISIYWWFNQKQLYHKEPHKETFIHPLILTCCSATTKTPKLPAVTMRAIPMRRIDTNAGTSKVHWAFGSGKARMVDSSGKGVLFWLFKAFICTMDPNMLMPTGTACTAVSLYCISKLDERSWKAILTCHTAYICVKWHAKIKPDKKLFSFTLKLVRVRD